MLDLYIRKKQTNRHSLKRDLVRDLLEEPSPELVPIFKVVQSNRPPEDDAAGLVLLLMCVNIAPDCVDVVLVVLPPRRFPVEPFQLLADPVDDQRQRPDSVVRVPVVPAVLPVPLFVVLHLVLC